MRTQNAHCKLVCVGVFVWRRFRLSAVFIQMHEYYIHTYIQHTYARMPAVFVVACLHACVWCMLCCAELPQCNAVVMLLLLRMWGLLLFCLPDSSHMWIRTIYGKVAAGWWSAAGIGVQWDSGLGLKSATCGWWVGLGTVEYHGGISP